MRKIQMKRLVFIFSTFAALLADVKVCGDDLSLNRHQLSIGPEWYQIRRNKDGGTRQSAEMYGGRFNYDRLKAFGVYWGAEASYAQGKMDGHTGTGRTLCSNLSEALLEARVGFTFQQCSGWQLSITPFIGAGYFNEQNNFKDPSPLSVHFETDFWYASAGFLAWSHPFQDVEVGLNFKVKYPYSPRCHVTNDPNNDPVNQIVGERFQYRLELPLTYRLTCNGDMTLNLAPFFDYRNYGGYPNFPFNFIHTSYKSWGATLQFQYRL